MEKIKYSYYTDEDASLIVDLMVRNKFGMGKYDQQLTAEKFIEYQEKKGFVFGVVGKAKGKVVSYVCCYQLGGQRVCSDKQIIIGVILIDSKFHAALFSISDMFSLLLRKIVEHEYLDMIAEVNKKNFPSLYMMGKTGFVVLDDTPTVHDDIVLHNYLPAIIKLVSTTVIIDNDILPKTMQPLNKRKVLRTVELDKNGCFETEYKTDLNEYVFKIDSATCRAVGVQVKHNGFTILQDLKNPYHCTYQNQNKSSENEDVTVRTYENGTETSCKTYSNAISKKLNVNAPVKTEKIEFSIPGQDCTYTFFTESPKKKKHMTKRNINTFAQYNDVSGHLNICEKNHVFFSEIWPCLHAPYLESILGPNEMKSLTNEILTKKKFRVHRDTENETLLRQYDLVSADMISIDTKAILKKQERELDPLFHFGFLDTGFLVKINLENGTCIEKKFQKDDFMYPELPFVDFQKEEYAKEYLSDIQIIYGDDIYEIKTEHKAKCFLHRNYIKLTINYESNIEEMTKNVIVEFGKIFIRHIENES